MVIESAQNQVHDEKRDVQPLCDGVGPVFHRRYSIEFSCNGILPEELMQMIQQDPNRFSPQALATFKKIKGVDGRLAVGDEFDVHVTGPWEAPVRVSEVSATAFTLSTLEGHLEAGNITFRVCSVGGEQLRFEIESLARSKDSLVNLLYDKIPILRFAQTTMWESYCKAVGGVAAENRVGKDFDVKILTERKDDESGEWVIL